MSQVDRISFVPRSLSAATVLIAWVALLAAGCGESADLAKSEQLPPPMVAVAAPTTQAVTQYEYFTGRTKAPESVEVRARVSGYLIKIDFKAGADVKKGDPLFEIDPDLYKADLESAEAEVARGEAKVQRLTAELARAQKLRPTGAVSQEELDRVTADKLESEAAVRGYKAKVLSAKLNLDYTRITAPISGVIGDRLVTEGNLVTGGQGNTTLLTTIVTVDPMNVAFDVDENTLQRLEQAAREGKVKQADAGRIPVEMGLALHGSGYPLQGFIYFVNNQVDPKTGTILVKAQFPNPKPANGQRLLTPGMYARVRAPIGQPVSSLLVPEVAIGSDQGSKYLYVVGPENKAVRLDATLGVQVGEMRVIKSVQAPGEAKPRPLRPDEKIIVSGLQRVHPGLIVDPKPALKS